MTEGNQMPKRCPLCNSKEVVDPVELSIRRETKEMTGISGMLQAGADKVAGWNYTRPVSVSVYFCRAHRNHFRNRNLVG